MATKMNKPTTFRELEEKFRKQFRELLISLSDITTNNDTSRPLKGDIYFDGIETEQWILNFFLDFLTQSNLRVIEKVNQVVLPKVQKFINKVESGRARSKETYSDMKEIRDFLSLIEQK